jgi:hypothetical protein
MKINHDISSILVPKTGYCFKEIKEDRIKIIEKPKKEIRKVNPVYDVRGKVVRRDNYGEKIDIKY